MCRGNSHGGRRCPGQSSPAAKKAAANRRRNNRRAKKNIKKFFTDQGMEDTAQAIDDITPSQIPGLMDALGIETTAIGDAETPVAVHAPADKRLADNIVSIAVQEMKDKDISDLSVTSDTEDFHQGTPTQEQISKAFCSLASKYIEYPFNEDGTKRNIIVDSVLDVDTSEDLEKLYSLTNKMELSDDYKQRSEQLKEIQDKVNEDIVEEFFPQIRQFSESLSNAIYEPVEAPFNSVTPKAKKTIPYTEEELNDMDNHEEYGEDVSRTAVALASIVSGRSMVYDLGDGFYYVEEKAGKNNPFGDYQYMYAPDGFHDIDTISTSRYTKFDRKPDRKRFVLKGMGMSGLDEDTKHQMMNHRYVISAALNVNNASSTVLETDDDAEKRNAAETVAERILANTLRSDVPQLDDKDISDIHVAHRISKGKTFLQENLGQEFSLNGSHSVPMVRLFRMGLAPRGQVEVDDSFQSYADNIVYNTEFNRTENEEQAVHKSFRGEFEFTDKFIDGSIDKYPGIKSTIFDYTSNSYKFYARDSMGVGDDPSYREKTERINSVVKDYQESNKVEPRTLFRGARPPYGMTAADYYDTVEVGEIVTTTKLTSSTYSVSSVSDFVNNNNIVSVFHTSKGMPIENFSEYNEEKEILIPAGEDYVCIGKVYDEEDEKYVFHYVDRDTMEKGEG